MSIVNNSLVSTNSFYSDALALNGGNGGKDYESVTYILTPAEAGAQREASGKWPPTVKLSEEAAERALFKKFGFDVDSKTDLGKLRTLLKAGNDSPFSKVETKGERIAYLNNKTGKYELKASVEKSLYLELQGRAATVKSQTDKSVQSPTNPNEAIAARNNSVVSPNNQANGANGALPILPGNVSPTIKDTVWMPKAGGATNDRTLLYHIQKKYRDTNLQGDNYQHIFDLAKASSVAVKINDVQTVGDQYRVSFEINRADEAKIENLYRAEQAETNRQIDTVDGTSRNTVAQKFAEGFFKGARGSLERNASMVYGAVRDPLGTAWKVGEALAQIPALPTKIGIGLGQAGVALAKLTPEQRQSLIDELISKGYTDLRDMPASAAAEKAGEIVGNLAMEAVLFKGASVGGKLTLEGLQTLKGTEFGAAFTSKVVNLSKVTAKTIGEIKVPVKATVEATVDSTGGVRPAIVTEKNSIAELLDIMMSKAKESEKLKMLEGGSKAGKEGITETAETGLTEKAQSGMKRLKKDLPKEIMARAKDQLVTLNVARTELIAKIDDLIQTGNILPDTKNILQRLKNSLQDHLKQDDLVGALRDIYNKPVVRSGDGYVYDHMDEVQKGLNSLDNAKEFLIDELKHKPKGSDEFIRLSENIDAIKEMQRRIETFLGTK